LRFWSQGDGASFECHYAYRKSASAEITAYAPQDETLHGIADTLHAIQRRNFYQLHAEASLRGHYCHEYCMVISVERDSPTWQDMTADAEDTVIEALRGLARCSIASSNANTTGSPQTRPSTRPSPPTTTPSRRQADVSAEPGGSADTRVMRGRGRPGRV
jgi:hypothetical protein